MSKLRELIKGDRVRITGPWCIDTDGDEDDDKGAKYIGKEATVFHVSETTRPDAMSITIDIDGVDHRWAWSREQLRALPRKGAAK